MAGLDERLELLFRLAQSGVLAKSSPILRLDEYFHIYHYVEYRNMSCAQEGIGEDCFSRQVALPPPY